MSDKMRMNCPECLREIKYSKRVAGQTLDCPNCKSPIKVRELPPEPVVAEAVEPKPGYRYRMIQIPTTLSVKTDKGNQAALFLEELTNDMAFEGWEFFRVDALGIVEPAGCIMALLGQPDSHKHYYVATFRRMFN